MLQWFGSFCVLVAVLGVPMASAQSGVSLVPIAYHPYPDDADPLGVPYWVQGDQAWGYFQGAYARLDQDRDGFDFPSLVVDGVNLVEGVIGGDHESTLASYREAWEARKDRPTPLSLTVNTSGSSLLNLSVVIEATGPIDETGLLLHWALVEDDVYYKPPPALSNGVFVHRFTAREMNPWPPAGVVLDGGRAVMYDQIRVDPDWDRDKLYVAVWVQNHAEANGVFELGEVVQATRHQVDGGATVQDASVRGVMMEMFTATWCPACLFGDEALNDLAAEAGFASASYTEPSWHYLRSPQWLPAGLGAGVGGVLGALVTVLVPRRRA